MPHICILSPCQEMLQNLHNDGERDSLGYKCYGCVPALIHETLRVMLQIHPVRVCVCVLLKLKPLKLEPPLVGEHLTALKRMFGCHPLITMSGIGIVFFLRAVQPT